MTKKIFAMFLAVLMVISLLPTSVFAAEKTCPGKGNHTVDNCNNTVVETVAPTCAKKGFTRYECADCGELFDDSIVPATGEHTYVDAPDKAPTCEENGYKGAKVCACGKVKGETIIPALNGGKYNCQWVIVNNATCIEGGTQEWECSACGAKKTVKVPKGAHNYTDFEVVVAATAEVPGKAVRTCKTCGEVDEVKVYENHNCKYFLLTIEAVEPTCTTAGNYDYKECRICGTKYGYILDGKLVNADVAGAKLEKLEKDYAELVDELIKPAEHDFGKVPTCADTLLQCIRPNCGKWVNPGIEHDIDWKVTDEEKALDPKVEEKAASCLKPGYIYDLCANCHVRHLKTLDALGHHTVTVTVPATCVKIGYTYTYCTRAKCDDCIKVGTVADKNGLSYNTQVNVWSDVTAMSHAILAANMNSVNAGFYFGFYHAKLDDTLYFTGSLTESGFLATSNNVAEATRVYLELVTAGADKTGLEFNGYRLYFYNAEGVKTYIVMNETVVDTGSKVYGKASVGFTTNVPADYYTWDATFGMLIYTTEVGTYRFGTYGTFDTIGATEKYYWYNDGQVFAKLSNVGVKDAVQLIGNPVFNYDGKTNASNHSKLDKNTLIPAECDRAGAGEYRCTDCGWSESFEIPAAHSYAPTYDVNEKVNGEVAYKPATCVDGYVYLECSECEAFVKKILPGYGHILGEEEEPVLDHEQTSGYVHTDCQIFWNGKTCGYFIRGEYKVWEGVNKVYSSHTAANTAHAGCLPLIDEGVVTVKGNCTTAKRTQYKCTCGVWVIVEEIGIGYGLHADLKTAGQYKPASCTTPGGFYTFKCSGCDSYVGSKPYAEQPTDANWNVEKATGHAFKLVDEDHECNDCDDPSWYDTHMVCANGCGEKIPCFKKLNKNYVSNGEDLCDTVNYEYYWCAKCDENHIRNLFMPVKHTYAPVLNAKGEIDYISKPSCIAYGVYTLKCTVCGDETTGYDAMAPHVNAAKEEFYNKCNSTVEDRHCIVCCDCDKLGASHNCLTNKDAKGNLAPCDCVIKTEHDFEKVKMPSTCVMRPYYKKTCVDCGKIENEEIFELNGKPVAAPAHKPAKIDEVPVIDEDGYITEEKQQLIFPGFEYAMDAAGLPTYTYTYYVVDKATNEWVEKTETYIAKFIDRENPSYTTEGYDHAYCQICKSEQKTMFDALEGLGFEISVSNANGSKGFTYGSLIEVTISANGNDVEFYGFEFNLSTTAGMDKNGAVRFVGGKGVNANFNVYLSTPAKALESGVVNVIGSASNDAAGKMQNLTVDGKTELVKLYFRVYKDAAAEYEFSFGKDPIVKEVTNYTAQKVEEVAANTPAKKFAVAKYLDFNGDGSITTSDAYLAMTLITGEQPAGLTYSVVVDIDKDGKITLADLSALYERLVENKSTEDLFKMGISAEELAILGYGKVKVCNNSECKQPLPAGATYCPVCGNHQ